MRSLFFTPKPEDVPEEPVSDRQPEENRADNTPDKHIKARRTKNVHFDRRIKSEQLPMLRRWRNGWREKT